MNKEIIEYDIQPYNEVVKYKNREVETNTTCRHFKGNLYQILNIAEHTESGETYVVYKALYGEGKVYIREISMFLSLVDTDKYPEVTQKYRFELVNDKISVEKGWDTVG